MRPLLFWKGDTADIDNGVSIVESGILTITEAAMPNNG